MNSNLLLLNRINRLCLFPEIIIIYIILLLIPSSRMCRQAPDVRAGACGLKIILSIIWGVHPPTPPLYLGGWSAAWHIS